MTTTVFQPWSNPILRWAGSKRKILADLVMHAPVDYLRYIEPFAGSACLFCALNPPKAVLGDINPELLHCYQVIKEHPRLLARKARSIPNDEPTYYHQRQLNPNDLEPIDRAARFIYLNRYCFNGIYRTNRHGYFNVPRGVKTGSIQEESIFYRLSVALRNAELRCGDFSVCLSDITAGDFVYLDPPYAVPGKRDSGEYGVGSFQVADITRLVEALHEIENKGAHFLLSYVECPTLVDLLPKAWNQTRLRVRRHIAGFSQHRTSVIEVLVSNFFVGGLHRG
ncbi:MAG: Dam family site-specific DNA-(adenine-N6)-methyltransferase [Chloracidobacterium sp.]|nr:Dam family site-specific DNA-(adenine-N6)-methyltransferase [Chloracidobacterium sp.]